MSMTDEKKTVTPGSTPAARALRRELFSDNLTSSGSGQRPGVLTP